PAPPVGTALGPHGINIMEFCKQYNAATAGQEGMVVPAEITVFEDRSFTFITKTPPTPVLIRAALGIDKGSVTPGRAVAGSISSAQISEIARTKLPDLNTDDLEAAQRQIEGTARSMGVKVQS
ncbi:MAG: 50S ribosomal protein L11, partial [Pseudonocardiaceae bacterium]